MVNDVSGLADPALAELCAEHGAALVITHTRVRAEDQGASPTTGRGRGRRSRCWQERIAVALERGVAEEQIVLDPGFDLGKTPGESVEILRRLPELEALGRPLLLAISRKDFVGADHRPPPGRARRRHARRDRARARPRRRQPSCACTTWPAPRDFLAVRDALREPRRDGRPSWRPELRREAGVSAFTIAQISDLHCGHPHFVPSLLDRAIVEINELAARRGDRVRRPHRRRLPRRVRAGARVPRPDRVRADDRDPGQPRLAQRRLRALRGAVRRAPLASCTRTACRSWPSTPPSPTSTTA